MINSTILMLLSYSTLSITAGAYTVIGKPYPDVQKGRPGTGLLMAVNFRWCSTNLQQLLHVFLQT